MNGLMHSPMLEIGPKICAIRKNGPVDYWLSIILDPCFKGKMDDAAITEREKSETPEGCVVEEPLNSLSWPTWLESFWL